MERKRFPTTGIYRHDIPSGYFLTEADKRRYRYITPAEGTIATMFISDCWIVDKHGNLNPGTNVSPVPVRRDQIGRRIGK